MKRVILACLIVGIVGGCASSSAGLQGGGGAVLSVDVFHDQLAPYGEWMTLGAYGRVWRPHRAIVGPDFHPYVTGGHWVSTDYGWSFESDWDWGWAPFHFGRWLLDLTSGWIWVPDTEWAPAWVVWRFGGGYAGWAPLPPLAAGIAIDTSSPYWCFVESRHFVHRDLRRYRMRPEDLHAAMAAAPTVAPFGPYHYAVGPPPSAISTAIGVPIQPVLITPPPPGTIERHRYVGVPLPPGGVPAAPGMVFPPPPRAEQPRPAMPPPVPMAPPVPPPGLMRPPMPRPAIPPPPQYRPAVRPPRAPERIPAPPPPPGRRQPHPVVGQPPPPARPSPGRPPPPPAREPRIP